MSKWWHWDGGGGSDGWDGLIYGLFRRVALYREFCGGAVNY